MSTIAIQVPAPTTAVAAALDALTPRTRRRLLALRTLILRTAASIDGVGEIEETLKWGEPAYLTRSRCGSTIRINGDKNHPSRYALYFNCQTRLVDTFRTMFGGQLRFEGNRAIVFDAAEPLPSEMVAICIAHALTYHRPQLLAARG